MSMIEKRETLKTLSTVPTHNHLMEYYRLLAIMTGTVRGKASSTFDPRDISNVLNDQSRIRVSLRARDLDNFRKRRTLRS